MSVEDIYKSRVRRLRLDDDKPVKVVKATLPSYQRVSDDEIRIRGWLVKWRDWQYLANSDIRVGVWVAYPEIMKGWSLYSAYPGNAMPFIPGQIFDMSTQEGQILPSVLSTEFDLQVFKMEALKKLEELINTVGSPPYDPRAVPFADAVEVA